LGVNPLSLIPVVNGFLVLVWCGERCCLFICFIPTYIRPLFTRF